MTSETQQAISWLNKNKGFVSLITGFVTIALAIMTSTWYVTNWAKDVVHTFDKRMSLMEQRLDQQDKILEILREQR